MENPQHTQSKKPAAILTFIFILAIGLLSYSTFNIARNLKEIEISEAITAKKEKVESQKQKLILGIESRTWEVTGIIDGDTIDIEEFDGPYTTRLIGIDTPETKHPSKPVECFGQEASNKLSELLLNERVRIAFDPSQEMQDRYNRTLLYIWRAEDNLFINQYMVENGYAHEYTYSTPYKYQSEFKAAENKARENHLGLWGDTCGLYYKQIHE